MLPASGSNGPRSSRPGAASGRSSAKYFRIRGILGCSESCLVVPSHERYGPHIGPAVLAHGPKSAAETV